jgi:hypothetical protein
LPVPGHILCLQPRIDPRAQPFAFFFCCFKGLGDEMRTAEHVERDIILRRARQYERHMPVETPCKVKSRL